MLTWIISWTSDSYIIFIILKKCDSDKYKFELRSLEICAVMGLSGWVMGFLVSILKKINTV